MADINTSCALVPGKWICHPEPVLLRGRGEGGRMGQGCKGWGKQIAEQHVATGGPRIKVASKMPTGIVKY